MIERNIAGLRIGMDSGSGSNILYAGDTVVCCPPPQASQVPKRPGAVPFTAAGVVLPVVETVPYVGDSAASGPMFVRPHGTDLPLGVSS